MARKAFSISIARTTIGQEGFGPARGAADPIASSGYAAAKTAFETALAQLVTDAASPTQAHVTTANSAYTTFAATLGSAPPAAADVVLSVNVAAVGNRSVLKRAVERLLHAVEGDNSLTA